MAKDTNQPEFEINTEGGAPEEEEQLDEEQEEGEPECEPEEASGKGDKPKKAQAKVKADHTSATPAPATKTTTTVPAAQSWTYPFSIRYASEILWNLTGFVDGRAYTADEIKEVLIQNDFFEFRDTQVEFKYHAESNVLLINIKGSVKGGQAAEAGVKLTPALLEKVEEFFAGMYALHGSEARVLVYRNEAGALVPVVPPQDVTRGSVRCDVDLSVVQDGHIWDLAFDLHSHHEMGAFWSPTDSANERIRGVTFGVFSWKGGQRTRLFRRFTGHDFEYLQVAEVVVDG